jgi:hypothetical protein
MRFVDNHTSIHTKEQAARGVSFYNIARCLTCQCEDSNIDARRLSTGGGQIDGAWPVALNGHFSEPQLPRIWLTPM